MRESEATVNEDILDSTLETGSISLRVYQPCVTEIVLGAGCLPEREVNLETAKIDGIGIRRRRGGGGTVVLSPGQVVVALAVRVSSPFRNTEYMRWINQLIIDALDDLGVSGIEHRGISDLAIDDRKILGSSLHRKKLFLFYQSSLLVENDLSLFERYLKSPPREPEYRKGRSHTEFCTSLRLEGFDIATEEAMVNIERKMKERLAGIEKI